MGCCCGSSGSFTGPYAFRSLFSSPSSPVRTGSLCAPPTQGRSLQPHSQLLLFFSDSRGIVQSPHPPPLVPYYYSSPELVSVPPILLLTSSRTTSLSPPLWPSRTQGSQTPPIIGLPLPRPLLQGKDKLGQPPVTRWAVLPPSHSREGKGGGTQRPCDAPSPHEGR